MATRFAAWRALDPRIGRLAAARAVNTLGLSLVMSFLGIYIIDERGYAATLYGAIALVANLGQSASNAWAGQLSDRIGRRPLIVGSLLARALVIAILGAQILVDASLPWIAVTFVVSSTLRGSFEPVAYALCTDLAPPHQRTDAFGLQRMGTNLGWALGPALGGLLSWVVPYGAVFFLAAAGMIAAAWMCRGIAVAAPTTGVPARARLWASLAAAAAHRPMRLLLIATVVFALAQTQMFTLFTVYLADELDLSKFDIGLVYMINGALVLLLQWHALGMIHRLGVRRVLPLSALGFAAGYLLVGLATGLATAMAAIALITAAEVLFTPAHQTAAAESSDPARMGTSFGLVSWAQTIGIAFAPLCGGALYDHIGHHHLALWACVSGAFLVLSGLLVAYGRAAPRAT
ncbi:MAG: MFS transporter [Myxococcales bacterium]|nr:MFS transporter [Myxococcales bacterium]